MSILPLTLTDVSLVKRGREVLGPVSFVLANAGCTVVIGPNGAGKTSLLRLMHGLEQPTAGSCSWAVTQAIAKTKQSFVFQTPILLRRSVLENLMFPLKLHKASDAQARVSALYWVERIGLGFAKNRNATRLSAGEKQKLSVARALITGPEVLFLDEPTANLDGSSTKSIEEMLNGAVASGTRLILATHDMGQARRLATEVVFLHAGKIIETRAAKQFFEAQLTTQATAFLNGDIVE